MAVDIEREEETSGTVGPGERGGHVMGVTSVLVRSEMSVIMSNGERRNDGSNMMEAEPIHEPHEDRTVMGQDFEEWDKNCGGRDMSILRQTVIKRRQEDMVELQRLLQVQERLQMQQAKSKLDQRRGCEHKNFP